MSIDVDSGVLVASPVEVDRLSMVLSAAFADNPMSDWLFDGEQDRHHPAFFAAYLTCAMTVGRVEQTSDGTAVAVWINQTASSPAEPWRRFYNDIKAAVGEHRARWEAFDAASEETQPTEGHWWLAFLGALPTYQGRGHGGRLLHHAANWVGTRPAYLEATSRRLAGFYARHGWHDTQPLVIPAGPILHRMRRPGSAGPASGNGTAGPAAPSERTQPSGTDAIAAKGRLDLPASFSRPPPDTLVRRPAGGEIGFQCR